MILLSHRNKQLGFWFKKRARKNLNDFEVILPGAWSQCGSQLRNNKINHTWGDHRCHLWCMLGFTQTVSVLMSTSCLLYLPSTYLNSSLGKSKRAKNSSQPSMFEKHTLHFRSLAKSRLYIRRLMRKAQRSGNSIVKTGLNQSSLISLGWYCTALSSIIKE
jgi:hypothetical protein